MDMGREDRVIRMSKGAASLLESGGRLNNRAVNGFRKLAKNHTLLVILS